MLFMNTITNTTFPEAKGISASCIIDTLSEIDIRGISMHSFLLCKDDCLVAEGYYAPVKKNDLHRMFSVTKSFVSIAIGLLQEEGRLSLDDSIVKFFPEYVPNTSEAHPWLLATTIRDMLSMRSCHASTTYDKFSSKTDWVKSFFTVAPTHKPGTVFHYDTSATHTLCALVEKLTGMKMLDYLRNKVLNEIGFSQEAYCLTDGFGVSMGGSGLMATSRDLMCFALLILHNGNLNGKQYISADYIKEATSFQTATCVTGPVPSESQGYGLQFWVGEYGSIVCYGMGGQLAILVLIRDGQAAVVVLFKACMLPIALEIVFAVQLDADISHGERIRCGLRVGEVREGCAHDGDGHESNAQENRSNFLFQRTCSHLLPDTWQSNRI